MIEILTKLQKRIMEILTKLQRNNRNNNEIIRGMMEILTLLQNKRRKY